MRWIRSSLALGGQDVTIIPSHLGDASIVEVMRPNLKDGLHEWTIGVAVRVGTTVLTLSLQGGKDLQTGTAIVLMQKIMANTSQACSETYSWCVITGPVQ